MALDGFCRQVNWHIRSCFPEFPKDFVAKHPLSIVLDRFCKQVNWHIRSCFPDFPEEFVAKNPLSIVLMG